MDRNPPIIPAETTVSALADRISRGDIMRAMQNGAADTTAVLSAAKIDVAVTYPDETLQSAVAKMLRRNIGRLPVVDPLIPGKVVGYLGRGDILAARTRLNEEEQRLECGPFLSAGWPNFRRK